MSVAIVAPVGRSVVPAYRDCHRLHTSTRIHIRHGNPQQTRAKNMACSAVVVGAGSAGLTAVYDIKMQSSCSVTVLEASAVHGGRVKKQDTILDVDTFPSVLPY
jgi:heterodisulfide reductase subunit A-like polyferredoxin